jgi:methionyl-tRNA synthetase
VAIEADTNKGRLDVVATAFVKVHGKDASKSNSIIVAGVEFTQDVVSNVVRDFISRRMDLIVGNSPDESRLLARRRGGTGGIPFT